MRTRAFAFILLLLAAACDKGETAPAKPAPSAAPAPAASAEPVADTPQGCQASGLKPTLIGTVLGDVFGFAQDGTQLYYTSWNEYGARGDVGVLRKDGKPARTLASLGLQPRGLVLDDTNLYYTEGIHLMSVAKAGGDAKTLVDVFSSQSIALFGSDIYGVPGDYGPYDRVAKVNKKGGAADEIATDKRPANRPSPNGYSRVLVDKAGVYVTDSGGDRVLVFPLPDGKVKTLAAHQKQAFDLAMDKDNLYFTLANERVLMTVPKAGGKAKKVASGLVKEACVAADDKGVITNVAGQKDDAPTTIAKVSTDGSVDPIAVVPGLETVAAIAVDDACVYYAVTIDASKSEIYAHKR